MVSKCEICEKKFSTDQGLLQHYSDKHPESSPPQSVRKREASRVRNRARNVSNKNHRKARNRALVVAGIAVLRRVLVAASAFYFYQGQHRIENTKSSSSISSTNGVLGIKDGDRAPDFPITFVNGTAKNLSDLSGHAVLIWFVTTWCSSCQQGGQMLNQQYYSGLNCVTAIRVD